MTKIADSCWVHLFRYRSALGIMRRGGAAVLKCTVYFFQQQGRRMSQRSTKRPKYNVDADSGEEEEGDADGSDDDEGDFQRLNAPPKARTPAKAPEQNIADAEPGPSQPGPSRSTPTPRVKVPAVSFCLFKRPCIPQGSRF